MSACGSTSDSGSSSSGGSDAKAAVTVAGYGPIAAAATLYIPLIEGYFKDQNLDVKIQQSGASNVLTSVVSGQADLGTLGAGAPVNTAASGKVLPIIYTLTRGLFAASVVGSGGATKISDCKRVATLGLGTSSYGGAAIYKKAYKLDYDIVPLTDYPTMLAGLASGSFNCAVAPSSVYASLVTSGKAVEVLDATSPETLKEVGLPDNLPDGVLFGNPKFLAGNKSAATRFLVAMNKGQAWIRSHSDEEVATALLTNPDYTGQKLEDLTAQVKSTRTLWFDGGDPGYISAKVWPDALGYYASEGLDAIKPDAKTFAYDKLVDMSFLKAATKSSGPVG